MKQRLPICIVWILIVLNTLSSAVFVYAATVNVQLAAVKVPQVMKRKAARMSSFAGQIGINLSSVICFLLVLTGVLPHR